MPDNQEHDPIHEQHVNIFNLLRRLQHHTRANIPALVAQRVAGSFTLQQDTTPQEATQRVRVLVYPQDPFVSEPEVRTMDVEDIKPGLINSRVQVQDSGGAVAQPDDEGDYLYWPDSPQFAQVNAFYYTTFTLRMYERFAQRALPWSFPSPRITIDPRVGSGGNAFYNEQDQLLGFNQFQVEGVAFNTAHSADIVTHEAAHAVLDGLRDLYNESFGLGAGAFHESFGDITAMLVALHDETLIRRLLDWTDGNLHMNNFVSALAEQITSGLQSVTSGHVRNHTVYLRNAFNQFKALSFDELLAEAVQPEMQLSRESHNYSRLFTGAFYDITVGIYERLRERMQDLIAIHRARDIMGYTLVCAIELGPVGEVDFSDLARAFITADVVVNDGAYQDIMRNVFDKRAILNTTAAQEHIQSLKTLPKLKLPETLNSALASALFLEREVLPALNLPKELNLIPLNAYRNGWGYAYISYFMSKRITLSGTAYGEFDGAQVDVFGGLTLMFDDKGDLRSIVQRFPTNEDLRQIQIMTADVIKDGLVVDERYPNFSQPLHTFYARRVDKPHALALPNPDRTDQTKSADIIVRFPVIFDIFADTKAPLRDYVQIPRRRD